jgi:uncharacterized membrane protein YfcA
MNLLDISLFFIVPAIAAAINSVAGGGTFLTFPVFIFYGLTPLQANIMSTIALWPGTISSTYGYRKELTTDRKKLLPLLIICVIGGTAGSLTLLYTPEVIFRNLVPWLLLAATLIFTFGRYVIVYLHKKFPHSKEQPLLAMVMQLVIAFYGGYFGAGIGILMLAMLQLMGLSDIHKMNALKTLLAAAINMATVVIFIFAGAVIWNLAAVMIAGGIFGGYVGARLALKVAPQHIRTLVSVIGFLMTAYFFLHDVR